MVRTPFAVKACEGLPNRLRQRSGAGILRRVTGTGTDALTAAALQRPPATLGRGSPIRLSVLPDRAAVIGACADAMLADFRAAKAAGREKVVFIVPVGPIGPLERMASAANAGRVALHDLVLINMDEYLGPAGRDLIPADHPLSFRGYMERKVWAALDPALAPPPEQRIFPDPHDPDAVARAIARWGGVDVCYGGVGITGHLAFNDPPEPGEATTPAAFADLPTRIVRLSRESILMAAINTARGNIDLIPPTAVTVGMREILAARKVRLYLHREIQAAILRKLLHGPVTPAVPASLLQNHRDAWATVAASVTALPQPELG
jgi:glucosamine-6-phosphate deaminase